MRVALRKLPRNWGQIGPARRFAVLTAVLLAQTAGASEFSVRLDDVSPGGVGVRVSLLTTCTSYECGRAVLTDEPPSAARPALSVERFLARGGVVRGSTPEDRDAWWVVVETGGGLPLAMLWRPPAADGDLPPAPAMEKASCRVEVLNEEGAALPGAHVAPVIVELPPALEAARPQRPAVFPGWRPWLQRARTDTSGRATLDVPDGGDTVVHVRADGYRSAATPCQAGTASTVRLQHVSAETYRLSDSQGHPLAGALARDHLGMPFAVSNAEGNIDIDIATVAEPTEGDQPATARPAVGTSADLERFWFETADGAVYELVGASSGRLIADERSHLRTGVIHLQDSPSEEPPAAPTFTWSWREPNWPWPAVDPRAARPLLRIEGDRYTISALPGEHLWFVAAGTSHAACAEPAPRTVLDAFEPNNRPCPALEAAPRIEGKVVDEAGAPIPDAEIRFDWFVRPGEATVVKPGPYYRGGALMRSDATGRFVGRHVPLDLRRFATRSPFSSRQIRVDRPPFLPIRRRLLHHFEDPDGGYRITLLRGVRISGRVVDALTAEPIGAAEVGLGQFSSRGARSLVLGPLDIASGAFGQRVRTTRTDPLGRFEMTAWPGQQELVVRAPGRASLMQRDLEVPTEGLDVGDIRLHAESRILGIVLGPDGGAVADAIVLAAGSYTTGALDELRTDTELFDIAGRFETDEQGRFRIPGLSDDSLADLAIWALGFATERRLEVPPTESAPLEVSLEPEAVITGRVIFRGDGVETWVETLAERGEPTAVRTDEDGRFRTRGLAAGRYNVVARSPDAGYLTTKTGPGAPSVVRAARRGEDATVSVDVDAGETVEVELELGLGERRLVGRVVEYGAGLAGVKISVSGLTATTDGDGRYAVDGLPSGRASVIAERGRSGGVNVEDDSQRKTVDIEAKSARLDFDFSVYEVAGRATLGDGSPVTGVRLSLRRVDDQLPFGTPATTNGDGAFRVRLPPGEYGAGVLLDGHWTTSRDTFRVRGHRSGVRVRFGHRLTISGAVHGLGEGEAARLQIEAVSDRLDIRSASTPRGSPTEFSISGLGAGVWTVIARIGNSGKRAERKVRLGDRDARIELVFKNLPTLKGTVLLDGLPHERTQVLLARGRDLAGARRFWTRHDGSYRFPDLEPGNYTLGVGAETRTVSVRGETDLTIELRSGRVEGFVTDSGSGTPLAGAAVSVWPILARRQHAEMLGIVRKTFVDAQGRFAFDGLPEGAWELAVDGIRGTRRINLRANAVIQIAVP